MSIFWYFEIFSKNSHFSQMLYSHLITGQVIIKNLYLFMLILIIIMILSPRIEHVS